VLGNIRGLPHNFRVNTAEQVRRYWAFISYSHADKKWADWLHRSLENYPMPRDLVGKPTPADAPVPKRFVPVFRDREELPSSSDLGMVIQKALGAARFLVVICSPRSAKSKWVEQEIVDFKRLHGEHRVLALIVEGEPWASDQTDPAIAETECFPRALRHRLGKDGGISDERAEPIAADARDGKDGRENAVIKLMAGLLGVGFDALRRREREYQRRRLRRLQLTCAGFAVLFIAAVSAAVYALRQKQAMQRTLSVADYQLGMQRRDNEGDYAGAAHFARALRFDPENRAAADVAWSMLAHERQHPPVGTVLKHDAPVSAAIMPDKERFVTAAGGILHVWSAADHRLLEKHPVSDGAFLRLCMHPDGKLALVSWNRETLRFLDTTTFKDRREALSFPGSFVKCARWSPSADAFAIALGKRTDNDGGGCIVICEADGREIQRVAVEGLSPSRLAWSPDGKHVAASGISPNIAVIARGEDKARYFQAKLSVSALRFADNDTVQALDIFLGQLKKWSLSKNEPVGRPSNISPVPFDTEYSPDGRCFIGMRRSSIAYLRDATDGSSRTAGISPGFTIAAGTWLDDQTLLLWDGTGLAQVRHVGADIPPMNLGVFDPGIVDRHALSPDGRTLALGTRLDEKTIQFYAPDTLRESSRRLALPSPLLEMCFTADGAGMLALCWDGILYQTDWRKGLRAKALTKPLIPAVKDSYNIPSGISFGPDRKTLLITDEERLRRIDAGTGEELAAMEFPSPVKAFCWSCDGSGLAVALDDQSVHFRRADGGTWPGKSVWKTNAPVFCMAMSSNEKWIAICSTDDTVTCHRTDNGTLFASSFRAGGNCTSISWMGDDRYLFVGCDSDRNRLVEPANGLTRAWLPVFAQVSGAPFVFPDRRSLLITAGPFFGRLHPWTNEPVPAWFPGFLEAFKAFRLDDRPDAKPIDPDAWQLPENQPPAGGGQWAELARWLMDTRPDRPVSPGSTNTDAEVAAVIERNNHMEKLVTERGRELQEKWNAGEAEDVLSLLDESIREFPDHRKLLGSKLQLAVATKDLRLFDQWLEAAKRTDSVAFTEMADAKVKMAAALMGAEPPRNGEAAVLLDDVLKADPEHPAAIEWKGKLPK
jgi:WD40 repeat protein